MNSYFRQIHVNFFFLFLGPLWCISSQIGLSAAKIGHVRVALWAGRALSHASYLVIVIPGVEQELGGSRIL